MRPREALELGLQRKLQVIYYQPSSCRLLLMPRLLDSARPPREVRSFRVLLIAIYTMRSLTVWEHAHAFVRRGARGTAQGGPAPAAGGNVQRVVCLRCGKSRRVLKEARFSWGLGPCATLAVGRPGGDLCLSLPFCHLTAFYGSHPRSYPLVRVYGSRCEYGHFEPAL